MKEMNKEELVSKWLDHDLTAQELEQFKQLPEYAAYAKLDGYASYFAAPSFDQEQTYARIQKAKKEPQSNYKWIKRIAAVVVLLVGTYTGVSLFTNHNTEFTTGIAEQQQITLPDQSQVLLNAGSTLSYNTENWENDRQVILDGEAFFKVEKGQKFEVKTPQGQVKVLGTQFNVKARQEIFGVQTYEGLVRVTHPQFNGELAKGEGIQVIENTSMPAPLVITLSVPSWIEKNSTFESVPYASVLKEMERQYEIHISSETIETQKLFTGSFIHTDLEQALRMITLPMQLTYTIDGNRITLTSN